MEMDRVLFAVLLLALAVGTARAQTADSLDPRGYFPLAVGNAWEYEHDMNRPLTADPNRTHHERYQIIGHDVVRDTTRYVLLAEVRLEDGSLISRDTSRLWYDSTTASIRGQNLPHIIEWLTCLDAPFGEPDDAPFECWPFVDQEEAYVFDSLYTAKHFHTYASGFMTVHGIGITYGGGGCEPCTPFDDHDNWTLRYARIDDHEYGVRIVHVEQPSAPSPGELLVYPNPSRGAVAVEVPGRGALSVYDLLGRKLQDAKFDAAGKRRIDLSGYSSGTYILRFRELTQTVVIQ